MDKLPHDIILKILNIHHFKCNDCIKNNLYYGKFRYCFYCKKKLCLYHYNLSIDKSKIYILLLQNKQNNQSICLDCFNFYQYLEKIYNMK